MHSGPPFVTRITRENGLQWHQIRTFLVDVLGKPIDWPIRCHCIGEKVGGLLWWNSPRFDKIFMLSRQTSKNYNYGYNIIIL